MPDAVVIGGGLVGCAVARALRLRGLSVTLLERSYIGAEASSAGAGMLAPQHGDQEPGAVMDLWCASRDMYPEFVRGVEAESGMGVGFRTAGTAAIAFDAARMGRLQYHAGWQRAAGLSAEILSRQEVLSRWPAVGPDVLGGVFLARDWWVDNRELMRALAVALPRIGVEVRTGSAVTAVRQAGGRACGVDFIGGGIDSPIVVNAAGAWLPDIAGTGLALPVRPARGHMLSLSAPALNQECAVSGGDFVLVPRAAGRIAVGATVEYAGFDRRPTAEGTLRLLNYAIRGIPSLAQAAVEEIWTGFRPESADGRPIIGGTGLAGYFVAGGHMAKGILLAPVTAACIGALIGGETPPLDLAPFSPMRFAPSA